MEKTDQYYQVLGLKPGASKGEIVQAYKTLMKTWYPQRNNEDQALREIAKEKLREIEEAYVRLSTPGSPPQRQGEGAASESKLASGPGQPGEEASIRENAIVEPRRSHETAAQPRPKKPARPSNSWFASEKMSVPLLVLLVAVTLGFYYPIWFLKRRNALNRLRSTEKIGSGVFIFAIVTISIGCLIPWLSDVENIEKIFVLVAGIPLLIQCFKVRRILHEHFNPSSEVETISAVATFFFQIYYLQYKINTFIDEAQASEYLIKTHAAEETSSPRSVRVLDTSGASGDQEKSAFMSLLGAIVGIAILIFIVASALKKGDAPVRKGNDVRQETKGSSLSKANRSSTDTPSSSLSREQPTFTQPPSQTQLNATDWYNKGESLSKSGMYREAIDAYSRAIDLNPQFAVAYFERGIAYGKKGNHDQMFSDYSKAIELDPKHTMAYYYRGFAHKKKGQLDQAISDCSKAIELNPSFVEAHNVRGTAYLDKRQYDQATSDFSKAIELNPTYVEAYVNRGFAYWNKGQYDQAISDYSKAIELNPRFVGAYEMRGFAYWSRRQYDQAISDLSKAIELGQRDAETYYDRGDAYEGKGEYEKAVEDLNRAVAINPKYHTAYGSRGMIRYKQKDYSGAIEDLSKATDLKPDSARAYDNRGYAYLELGKYQSAMADFRKAIELNEKCVDCYIGLAIVSFLQKRTEEAKAYYQKAVEIEPLCKNGLEALEKEKNYFYTPSHRATVKAILKPK
jgi:tetratricopeptide (TPR) repeat protein